MSSPGGPATARGGRAPLDRDRIVREALRIVDAEGLEAVTMRRLADALGVQAPSLYNHVRGKDAVLEAVGEVVMADVDVAGFGTVGWRAALERWAWSSYDALAAHPRLVPYLATALGRTEPTLRRAEQVYAGLRAAGWSPARATRIAAAARYAVYGAAIASFAGSFEPGADYRDHPALADAGRLPERAAEVDRRSLALLLDALFESLEPGPPTRPRASG